MYVGSASMYVKRSCQNEKYRVTRLSFEVTMMQWPSQFLDDFIRMITHICHLVCKNILFIKFNGK